MPLEILTGDLFKVPAPTKVITINLVGAMGAGVAKTARDTIPGIYERYLATYNLINPDQTITHRHDGVLYLMIPTKLDWRDPSPRDLVVCNLNRLAVMLRRHPELGPVALPPMGCGNGGLDWENDIRYVYMSLFNYHPVNFITVI